MTEPLTTVPADAGTPPDSYEQSRDACARLRSLARIAGVRLVLGTPQDTPKGMRVPLGWADTATVHALAAIIEGEGEGETCSGKATDHRSLEAAVGRLEAAARVAGVDVHPGTRVPGAAGPWLSLGEADDVTLTRLADLVEASLTTLLEATEGLRAALFRHGVTAQHITADQGAVHLREVTVPQADVLLRLLTSAPTAGTDPDDAHAGERLAARITTAVQAITAGATVDAAYAPLCPRCDSTPGVLLGAGLQPAAAHRLTAHLNASHAPGPP